eukprot:1319936-Rhodomonas_salina.2
MLANRTFCMAKVREKLGNAPICVWALGMSVWVLRSFCLCCSGYQMLRNQTLSTASLDVAVTCTRLEPCLCRSQRFQSEISKRLSGASGAGSCVFDSALFFCLCSSKFEIIWAPRSNLSALWTAAVSHFAVAGQREGRCCEIKHLNSISGTNGGANAG